jgi:hypothetical protein
LSSSLFSLKVSYGIKLKKKTGNYLQSWSIKVLLKKEQQQQQRKSQEFFLWFVANLDSNKHRVRPIAINFKKQILILRYKSWFEIF